MWPGEEPWEREIHELLSSLPMVDPPEGFLQRAIDHRPKYAGRLSLLAVTSVVAATLGLVGFGVVGDRQAVAPAVPALAARHGQVVAGLGPGGRGGAARFEPVEETAPVALPAGFQAREARRDGDLVQVVYDHAGQKVSVFAQRGSVSWDRLPPAGLGKLHGKPVWSDAARRIVIVESGPYVVVVVGLDVDRAKDLLRDTEPERVSAGDRVRALAREVARQAGFP